MTLNLIILSIDYVVLSFNTTMAQLKQSEEIVINQRDKEARRLF